MGGAILAGDKSFIEQARTWRARLGGLLVEPWPAIADALRLLDCRLAQVQEFVLKARSLAASVAAFDEIKVDPDPPHTNMFHIILTARAERCEIARDVVSKKTGIWLSNRFWAYEADETCALEVVVGEKAMHLQDNTFRNAISLLLDEIGKAQTAKTGQ